MPIDPFAIKSLSKCHPRRVLWTAYARTQEKIAALRFASLAVPLKHLENIPEHKSDTELTAVWRQIGSRELWEKKLKPDMLRC